MVQINTSILLVPASKYFSVSRPDRVRRPKGFNLSKLSR
jgi:hypothetical protein